MDNLKTRWANLDHIGKSIDKFEEVLQNVWYANEEDVWAAQFGKNRLFQVGQIERDAFAANLYKYRKITDKLADVYFFLIDLIELFNIEDVDEEEESPEERRLLENARKALYEARVMYEAEEEKEVEEERRLLEAREADRV